MPHRHAHDPLTLVPGGAPPPAIHAVVADGTANPAPLGLLGFGMTTVLLNLHNAGVLGLGSMILAMGIFYGGIAQVIAGVMEWKKRNTFGTVAFTSYGLFWLSLVATLVLPRIGWAEPTPKADMAAYLLAWGGFTAILALGTLRMNRAIQVVFFSLTALFALLGAADATGSAALAVVAGWEGIACGLSAVYLGAAQILNEVYGRTVLPIGPVRA
jgi:succinate-acetate transporter protein